MSPTESMTKLQAIPATRVDIRDEFWKPRQLTNHRITIRRLISNLRETGRIRNFARAAGLEDGPFVGMLYNDSDVYKVIEAASHSLSLFPDEGLKEEIDGIVDVIAKAQQPDGYLNTYFTLSEPDKRWTNLSFLHELFCAGHLVEAALAYNRATGETRFLQVATRFVDYIYSVFGPDGREGYPGHQELELALVALYRQTGTSRYLELAKLFLLRRGQQPSLFAQEFDRLDRIAGSEVQGYPDFKAHVRALFLDADGNYDGAYAQDHLPLRQQEEVLGHAVRAMYQYCGMADVALESGDQRMAEQLELLWRDMSRTKMYVTGGIGSSHHNEGFTEPFDLPNKGAFSETCASVGSILWNHRMFLLTGEAKYYDLAERVLYNSFLAGVSHDGERFFYINPLESDGDHHREPWFDCACCPPNAARLIGSIGGYIYAAVGNSIYLNLYIGSSAELDIEGVPVVITQTHSYPWEGKIEVTVEPAEPVEMTLRLRVPEWAEDYAVHREGVSTHSALDKGYVSVGGRWHGRQTIELTLSMEARALRSDPRVPENRGKTAFARGPLVYCFEEADNGPILDISSIRLAGSPQEQFDTSLPERAVTLDIPAARDADSTWNGKLYKQLRQPQMDVVLKAVPYFLWDNREPGKMKVWLPGC